MIHTSKLQLGIEVAFYRGTFNLKRGVYRDLGDAEKERNRLEQFYNQKVDKKIIRRR